MAEGSGDGGGREEGSCTASRPPLLELQGSQKEPPRAAWPRWVVASPGGKPSASFLFFLSKFESKAVQGLRGWRGDAEGSSKLSQGRERQGPRPAGPGQGPGEVYRPTWLRAGQSWAELATGGPAGPSTSRALRVLDIG